jgi:hypothetical protein
MITTSTGLPTGGDSELAVAEERDRAQIALGQPVRGDHVVAGLAQPLDRVAELHAEETGRVVEPLQVIREPEDRGALRGLVRPDPLEDARAVVQPVGADVNARVVPVDEGSVHPDLLGLTHAASLLLTGC